MQPIEEFIIDINQEFIKTIGGSFVKLDTGEIFTNAEVEQYIEKRLSNFQSAQFQDNNQKAKKLTGVRINQRLVSNNSKKPEKHRSATKGTYLKEEKTEFNIVHRPRLEEVTNMQLNKNEKLVYYILRDLISHPSNCVMINNQVPVFKELEPLVSLTERTIRDALKTLEEKNLLKLVQTGHRKAIYINPEYYATGKELNITTLELFGLLELDQEKVESYL